MWRVSRYQAALAVIATSLLGACSSDSSDGGDGDDGNGNLPDPCELVASNSLGPIVGEDLIETESFSDAIGPGCNWFNDRTDVVFTTTLAAKPEQYDPANAVLNSKPVSGVGSEAYLGRFADVWVKTAGGNVFMAQSLFSVSDGQVSSPIQTAGGGGQCQTLAVCEASYRLAKLLAGKL